MIFPAHHLLLWLACVAAVTGGKDNSEDSKIVDNKVDLGWPKFFNPDKAILRKTGAKKATSGDKKSILGSDGPPTTELTSAELLEENRLVNKLKDEARDKHEDWERITDFQIKDQLRGTLVPVDPLTDWATGWEDALPAHTVQLIREELRNESDVYEILSEVTDDGLRLAMPLFRQRYSSAMGKFGAEISFFYGPEPVKFLYYGNWCGRGGRIAPVDTLDTCCMQHAKCKGRLVKSCPDVWHKPYDTMYAWTLLHSVPYCVRSEVPCINEVCACDMVASLCMRDALVERGLMAEEEVESEEQQDPTQKPLKEQQDPLPQSKEEDKHNRSFEEIFDYI